MRKEDFAKMKMRRERKKGNKFSKMLNVQKCISELQMIEKVRNSKWEAVPA